MVDKSGTTAEMQKLIDQATANEDAEKAAIDLLTSLSARLSSVAGNVTATQALAAELKGSADALGAAIVANTPAA
ncbi:MAG: hypothetical protein DMG30_12000 [Acidobacteria bacterium]|nr:MAG: hypothetical protein DMG30_12000 [Acidobacteriota bacterium]